MGLKTWFLLLQHLKAPEDIFSRTVSRETRRRFLRVRRRLGVGVEGGCGSAHLASQQTWTNLQNSKHHQLHPQEQLELTASFSQRQQL